MAIAVSRMKKVDIIAGRCPAESGGSHWSPLAEGNRMV